MNRNSLNNVSHETYLQLKPKSEWTGRDLNPRPPPCEGGVHTKLNYRPFYISVTDIVCFKILVNTFRVDRVNLSLCQSFKNILWVLSMILEYWFTVFVTNIMSHSIVVLANMLKIAYYSTDLTHNLNHTFTLQDRPRSISTYKDHSSIVICINCNMKRLNPTSQ